MENPTETNVSFDHKKKEMAIALYKAYFGKVARVCREIQINRCTFYEWKNTDEKFKQAIDSIDFNSYMVDLAEQQMLLLIKGFEYEEKHDIETKKTKVTKVIKKRVLPSEKLIIYLLENKGKNRGYAAKDKDGDKPSTSESELEKRERILQEMLERAKQDKQGNSND